MPLGIDNRENSPKFWSVQKQIGQELELTGCEADGRAQLQGPLLLALRVDAIFSPRLWP